MEPIRRSLPGEITPGDGRTLRGFVPYDSPTQIVERGRAFTEVIRRGAFARALAPGKDVISTFNHNPDRMLGRTSSGTLRLSDSAEGLRYEVDLPDSAADVRELLARGDLRGSSFFAFPLADGGQRWTKRGGAGGQDLRELTGLEMVEIGPVVMPAYADSGAVLRALDGQKVPSAAHLAAALVKLMERS